MKSKESFRDYVESHRHEVYNTILEYVPLSEPSIERSSRIMRDYIERQGSYRRPGLLMLTGQLFGAPVAELLLPAVAEQLSEDWILMQDDVEDGSELRRGKPAAQILYGEALAFNASNVGQMAMWRVLKDYVLKYGTQKGNRVFEKFFDMLMRTVEGQHVENEFNHRIKRLDRIDEGFYFKVAETKTCYYTVYGPMQIGALVANQSEDMLEMIEAIGRPVGTAFQIRDDILDMTADEKQFGKKRYGDLYEGKVTLMILRAFANANATERNRINSIYAKVRKDKTLSDIQFLVSVIEKYDGIGYATEVGECFVREADAVLKKNESRIPDNEFKPIFKSAMRELYARGK